MPKTIPLLVIAGPTASGKTEAAMRVARSVGGEIVSADSMQIYRQLDVGTAKPTLAQRRLVRFHLVDFVEPDRPYTVADFQRHAQSAVAETWGRGNLPILCGGTGLYIRALLQHFVFPTSQPPAQAIARRSLERELEAAGSAVLHARLAAIDPTAAARIDPTDARRTIRALEVHQLTGQPISAQQRVDAHPPVKYNLRYFLLDPPRPQLYARIEARVDRMMAAGWLDEARAIRLRGYSPALQSLQAIGYRHLLQWIQEREARPASPPLATVVDCIKRDTRRFAKRQLTWFRRETQATWLTWSDQPGLDQSRRQLCRAAQQLCEAGGAATRSLRPQTLFPPDSSTLVGGG